LNAVDRAAAEYEERGYAVLPGLFTAAEVDALEVELAALQDRLLAGDLPPGCGTVILDDPDALIDGEPFAHYVCEITRVSKVARDAVLHPAVVEMARRTLGPDAWLLEDDRFGVVYQDARPGDGSAY